MSFLINMPNRNTDKLVQRLSQHIAPDEIDVYPNIKQPNKVTFALLWGHEHGSLSALPNLKGISSFGAGVDAILSDPKLPDVPVARIVDPRLATDMAKYVTTTIHQHTLRFAQFRQQQNNQLWKPKSKRKGQRVGILGMGQLGLKTAQVLTQFDYQVSGWSRTAKTALGIDCLSGQQGLQQVVQQSDYLVCLLPLTPDTHGILNSDLFKLMPEHAVLINVARGQHVVENDLLQALDQQRLEHAYLDVFSTEPLPVKHPFWQHANISITPHISAVTDLDTAVSQIVNNYNCIKDSGDGANMMHLVDRNKGY